VTPVENEAEIKTGKTDVEGHNSIVYAYKYRQKILYRYNGNKVYIQSG
jgi:hypothetical protein